MARRARAKRSNAGTTRIDAGAARSGAKPARTDGAPAGPDRAPARTDGASARVGHAASQRAAPPDPAIVGLMRGPTIHEIPLEVLVAFAARRVGPAPVRPGR